MSADPSWKFWAGTTLPPHRRKTRKLPRTPTLLDGKIGWLWEVLPIFFIPSSFHLLQFPLLGLFLIQYYNDLNHITMFMLLYLGS